MLVGENAATIQGQHRFNIDQVFEGCSAMMEPETIDGPCVSLIHQRKTDEKEKKISVLIGFVPRRVSYTGEGEDQRRKLTSS